MIILRFFSGSSEMQGKPVYTADSVRDDAISFIAHLKNRFDSFIVNSVISISKHRSSPLRTEYGVLCSSIVCYLPLLTAILTAKNFVAT